LKVSVQSPSSCRWSRHQWISLCNICLWSARLC